MTTTASVPSLTSYVAGEWRDGGRRTEDINPTHPAEVVANVAMADADVAGQAIRAASAAYSAWRAMPAPSRGEILHKAATLIDARADAIGRDLTREEGKTLAEGVGETRNAAKILRYYAAQTLDPDGDTYPSHRADTFLYTRREPLGVVTVITPWNFPIAIAAWKIAPALAFGNVVVWKPAELVPLTAAHFLKALIDAGLPSGVVNLVLGRGSEVGDVLATHPDVAAVTFTGSNIVGRALQAKASATGKRVQLELGGKNPAIVLADADLDLAAEQVARGAFVSAGQKCTATSRVIVERSVLDGLVERLTAHARDWKLGDPLASDTVVGPLVSDQQLTTVLGYLDRARSDGARVIVGGGRGTGDLADGFFVRPTVLSGVKVSDTVFREEIFGPVAAVLAVDSFDEAVAMANDTRFGLSASIFTRDLGRALRFADRIHSGIVKVNAETPGVEYHVPFGGTKESSSGSREQGKAAREFFTESKTVYINIP